MFLKEHPAIGVDDSTTFSLPGRSSPPRSRPHSVSLFIHKCHSVAFQAQSPRVVDSFTNYPFCLVPKGNFSAAVPAYICCPGREKKKKLPFESVIKIRLRKNTADRGSSATTSGSQVHGKKKEQNRVIMNCCFTLFLSLGSACVMMIPPYDSGV